MLAIILVLICSNTIKYQDIAEELADMIELNHKYDDKGIHTFDQIIYWHRRPENGKYCVRAWHIVGAYDSQDTYPVYNHKSNLYIVNWYDRDARLHRIIKSRIYRETWTHNDPEKDDKKHWPEECRIKLIQRHIKLPIDTETPELTHP